MNELRRRRRARPALLAMLALYAVVFACNDPSGPAVVGLTKARLQWQAAAPPVYTLTIVRGCECLPASVGPVTLVVRDGAIESMHYVRTGERVEAPYTDLFPDVPGLFELIEDAHAAGAARILVDYHERLGYPQRITIDYHAQHVDDEITYRVTEFAQL